MKMAVGILFALLGSLTLTAAVTDVDVINFALNLDCLEVNPLSSLHEAPPHMCPAL